MMQFSRLRRSRPASLEASASLPSSPPALASTLQLFVNGGYAILDAIAAQGYDTLKSRPVVTKTAKLRLLGGALAGKLAASLKPSRSSKNTSDTPA